MKAVAPDVFDFHTLNVPFISHEGNYLELVHFLGKLGRKCTIR